MTDLRPYRMLEDLFDAAARVWQSLPAGEWLAAFDDVRAPAIRRSTDNVEAVFLADLDEAAGLYHDKFGFTLVVDERGKSSEEMLAICRARLGNSPRTEFNIAGEEYRKIIEDRLSGVLER